MRRILFLLAPGLLAFGAGCRDKSVAPNPREPVTKSAAAPAPPEVAIALHFAGLEALSKNPAASKQAGMFQAPATRALVHAALEKLAVAATRGFATSSNATAEFLAPMRPLLADIPTVESVVAVRGTAASEDWALALRLGPARLAAWTNQLQTAVKKLPSPSWNLGLVRGVVHGDFGGADPKVRVKFQQVGDWLLFGGGPGKRALLEAWLADAKSSGTPRPPLGADWLRVEAGPQLARLLDWPDLADWPHLTAGFSSRSDIVRTEARLSWREPMVSSLQPWQVPTNTIRDPLVSFTAARGVAPWLGRNAALRTSAAGPVPDQWFSWSRSDIPFQTLFALPAKDAAARVPALLQPLESAARAALGTNFTGRIHHVTDRNEVVWSGLPILVPFVGVAPEPSGSFILGGLMSGIVPQGVNTNPAPAELLAQLGRTNLVYYDWEVTQFRLQQVRQTRQLLQLLGGPGAGLMGRTPGQAWLDAIAPQLGNTITEATIDGPKELRVIRNSHAGLTGFELLMLARWLDNPDFPAWREPAAAFPGLPPVPSLPPGK